MSLPELIAHRGYAARFPENTLVGIQAAVSAGARFVEVDVQLSADGVPVLFHDADLLRICGVPGAVHEWDFAALMRLRAAEAGRFVDRFADNPLTSLAQLAELLARHPGVTAFVEAKTEAGGLFGEQSVLEAISRTLAPVAAQCVLISFSLPLLQGAVAYQGSAGWHDLGGVVDRWEDRNEFAGLGLGWLFCDVNGLPGEGPLAFETARLAVYEVDDARQALDLVARGVAAIETFALPELRKGIVRLAGLAEE